MRIWNLQSYRRNRMQNLQRLIKNEVELPVAIKNKSCGIPGVLDFWSLDFLSNLVPSLNF